MKKIVFYSISLVLSVSLMYVIFLYLYPDIKKAPKLFFKDELYLDVKRISFERNYLYLNDTLYDAGGISEYSRIHSDTYENNLMSINPPFRIEKLANNDTLKIIKGSERYYLLVSREQNFVKNNSGRGAPN